MGNFCAACCGNRDDDIFEVTYLGLLSKNLFFKPLNQAVFDAIFLLLHFIVIHLQ